MYYVFICNMWIMRRLTESGVQAYCPRYITQIEVNMILLTPQMTELEMASIAAV